MASGAGSPGDIRPAEGPLEAVEDQVEAELELAHVVRPGRGEVMLDVLDQVRVVVGREALQERRGRARRGPRSPAMIPASHSVNPMMWLSSA